MRLPSSSPFLPRRSLLPLPALCSNRNSGRRSPLIRGGGPLDFLLNDEQQQLKKSVREFAEREIGPHVMEWDESGEFPVAIIKELGRLGLMGTVFPQEYGGAGMGYVEYVTAVDELSRVDGSVGIIVAAHTSLCTNHIFLVGTE